ncbi:MAG: response regulator [Bacteroidetes bacterium]|nr:response regulator [Bacteroidota bacterium]
MRSVVIILLLACCGSLVYSQEDSINFTSLTSKDGLSSNNIRGILKDRYGWMWFATEDGLNRFDGNRYTVYRHSDVQPGSLPANDIGFLHEDKAGNFWVGTYGGGLTLYDRKNDTFINVNDYAGGGVLKGSSIRAIISDASGMIWVGTFEGLHLIDPVTRKLVALPYLLDQDSLLSRKQVNCFFVDSKQHLWIGSINGLYMYDFISGRVVRYRHFDNDPSSLAGSNVKVVAEDKRGNIWVGSSDGLSMLLPDEHSFRNFRQDNSGRSISSNLIFSITPDRDNNKLWIGTEDGLNILDPESGEVMRIVPDRRRTYGLSRKSVRSIYIDDQGIYWVGTYQGGINKFDKNLSLFQLRQSNPFDEHGLSSSVVTSFAEGRDSTVYIGTDGGGLNVYNRKSGLFSHLSLSCAGKEGSGALQILSMERDRLGGVWIGTYARGMYRLEPSGACRHWVRGAGPDSINNNDIFCIKEDREGKVWIGTNGSGICVYDPGSGKFRVMADAPDGPYTVRIPMNNYIRAIEEDTSGNMCIASHGGGLTVLNPKTGSYKIFTKANSNIPTNTIISLLRDSRGKIWLGTGGGGISLFDPRQGSFLTFSEKDGLANGVVYKILEDSSGLLWVSTNAGISSFDPKGVRFTNYTHHNGVQKNNFVLGSGIRLRDGEIYFGGVDGFNFFDPRLLKHNTNVPAVVLTELRVANQTVVPAADGPIREQISTAGGIYLGYRQSFTLGFAALDYTSAQQNTYAYKLEGFDRDWNYVGASKTASYTNLDPGDYVFRVKVRNSDGVWNTKGASIEVHIKPPFWRTIYAYLLYVVLVVGVFWFYRHKTVQKLQRRFAVEEEKRRVQQLIEQERKEAEVARELDQMKIRFLTNLSHEFRTPISLIMGPVDNLLAHGAAAGAGAGGSSGASGFGSTAGELGREGELGQLQMIRRNARRLLNLVNQLLDFRKMEENELSLHATEGEVVGFMKEAFDSFRDLSERKGVGYTFCSKERELWVRFDQDKLERILFNLLSNAFKFTRAGGSVRLDVERLAQGDGGVAWLLISVSDTGIGISAEKKDKIFERFYQINSPTLLNQGSGIGLSIANEFVKMQGGSIEVESSLGVGTVFKVRLPFEVVEAPVVSAPAVVVAPVMEESLQVEVEEEEEMLQAPSEEKEKPVILLVEDDDDFRCYLKDNLQRYYKVIESSNGKEGWQKALAYHPLVVVSDINMPVMDGIRLSNKIKSDKRTNHIPVILLTALTGEEQQLKGLATGASDYVTKPFNFEILNSKIRNLLLLNHSLKTAYSRQIQVQVPEKEIISPDAALIKEVRLYIEEHLVDPQLSVDLLSKHIGMSRSSFYGKMLDLTGQTPIEYIRSVKLEKAAVLLEKSNLNVAQVAYETGFATPNYFAKSFRAKFNMLPSEYASSKRKRE